MPKVLIIPHYHYENELANFLSEANATQADFKFYLLPPELGKNSPLRKPVVDYLKILEFLAHKKEQMGFNSEDLLIVFYDGVITAIDQNLTNLFIAAASIDDYLYPCTAAVSLQFISWGILEQKYDYSLQRHALFHLVMCTLIGAYTKLTAHYQTYGCLLDFNNRLVDFNRKLQMGYYLCSTSQKGCYDAVKSEIYGKSIIKLCEILKEGIDQNKLKIVVNELIMGNQNDTYNIGQAGAVGRNARSDNNIFFQSEKKQTLAETAKEIQELLEQLSKTNPPTTTNEQKIVATQVIQEIEDNPTRKQKAIAALKAGSLEALKSNPIGKIIVAAIDGWEKA